MRAKRNEGLPRMIAENHFETVLLLTSYSMVNECDFKSALFR